MNPVFLIAALVHCPLAAQANGHAAMLCLSHQLALAVEPNLGGLKGADVQYEVLEEAVGITGETWAAYLSVDGVKARDRIGEGPWINHYGVTSATDLGNLYDAAANALSNETSVSETGAQINGR